MKKHLKAIIAATLALALCAAMAGCGATENEESKQTSAKTSENSDVEKSEENADNTEQPKTSFAPTQEIINADLSSGLIQIGNEIFDNNEHLTVAGMYERYSDKYDITYGDSPYESKQDSLIEPLEFYKKEEVAYAGSTQNILYLTPKEKTLDYTINVEAGNLSTTGEKIKLSELTVFFYEPCGAPAWTPMGYGMKCTKDLQRINEDYTAESMFELLKNKGYEYKTISDDTVFLSDIFPDATTVTGLTLYSEKGDFVNTLVRAEKSPSGYLKLYNYWFYDSNISVLNNMGYYIIKL